MIKFALLFSFLCILSCSKGESEPTIKSSDYPKEIPKTFYDYSDNGYISQYAYKCDLSVYNGKVIKEIRTDNTDLVIHFTDGTYMHLDIYKYRPKLKFYKKSK